MSVVKSKQNKNRQIHNILLKCQQVCGLHDGKSLPSGSWIRRWFQEWRVRMDWSHRSQKSGWIYHWTEARHIPGSRRFEEAACLLNLINDPLWHFLITRRARLHADLSLTYGGSLRLMVVAKSGSRMGWIVTKIVLSSSGRIPHRILLTIFYQNRVKSALFLFLALAF